MKANVKCDACGYLEEVEFESIPDYYNKNCPSCNEDVLINDFDMEVFQAVAALEKAGLVTEPEEGGRGSSKIDTADGELSITLRGDLK